MLLAPARGPIADTPAVGGADPSASALVIRLRDEASQLVAFSRTKTLLREAASMIERLEGASRLSREAPR
jgi:hypothetical protein